MTKPLSRTSVLADRHKALGSGLEDWNGMGTAWTYATDPDDEHDAVRERVGMFDMSPLKKIFVRGPDAAAALDHLTTRDMSRIAPGQAAYLSVLTEAGTMADDAIVSNNGGDEWMIVHGSGDTFALLAASAEGRKVSVQFTDDLHDISVQGPRSAEVLERAGASDIASLAYFHHRPSRLFGCPVRISRTGYSGERGYEIFVDAAHAGTVWDGLAAAGVMPCSFTALDKLRIEAGLLFYGYDMNDTHTPWEVGLGFTVSRRKADFRGRDALFTAEGHERLRNVGLRIDMLEAAPVGAELFQNNRLVGTVNSPCWSRRLGRSLALAHVAPDVEVGTVLTLRSGSLETAAIVVQTPVHDPAKSRTHG
jgi:aminomethyltransferase